MARGRYKPGIEIGMRPVHSIYPRGWYCLDHSSLVSRFVDTSVNTRCKQVQIGVRVQHWNIPNLPKTKIAENKWWSVTIIHCVFHLFQKVLLVRLSMSKFIKYLFSIEFLLMAEWIIPSLRKPSNHQVTAISSHVIHVLPDIVLPISILNRVCTWVSILWKKVLGVMVVTWQFCHKNWMLCCTPLPNMQQLHQLFPPTYDPTPQNRLFPFWLWLCGMPELKLSYNIGTTISFNFDRETVHAAKRNFQCQGIPVIMITLVPQMSFASAWERPKVWHPQMPCLETATTTVVSFKCIWKLMSKNQKVWIAAQSKILKPYT